MSFLKSFICSLTVNVVPAFVVGLAVAVYVLSSQFPTENGLIGSEVQHELIKQIDSKDLYNLIGLTGLGCLSVGLSLAFMPYFEGLAEYFLKVGIVLGHSSLAMISMAFAILFVDIFIVINKTGGLIEGGLLILLIVLYLFSLNAFWTGLDGSDLIGTIKKVGARKKLLFIGIIFTVLLCVQFWLSK